MAGDPRFDVTADFSRLGEPDAVLVCVPTPVDEHLQPDLHYLLGTMDAVARVLRPGQLVVVESTTYPGTTREQVRPRLERSGLQHGRDFFVAFSPEREDPGRKGFTTRTIPKLVGGVDARSGELAAGLYRHIIDQVVPVRRAEIAEAAKLLENIYRAVNIALVNEMKVVLTAMDVDIWEVIEAAKTKPFGYQAFYPGPGLGGHCIPVDPFYMTYKAREVGESSRFIELAGEVNRSMPDHVVRRVMLALNDEGKPVRGSRILVLGLAYKPDVDDCRESPSFPLIAGLRELGAHVDYSDPHVPTMPRVRKYDFRMHSVELTAESLAGYDCVLVATHHSDFDWGFIAEHSSLVVDTRNVLSPEHSKRARVVRA
jgi:UDP-N-acetyl-D-glucosamine dehydrogenase